MRTETRTRMMPQYYNVYIADDGTEFSSLTECKNYEEREKKIEIKGVVWYDRNGNILPLILDSWEKVVAIHFENDDADYDLYNILEASCYDMSANEQTKLSAFGNSPTVEAESYLMLYDNNNEVWENVEEKYGYIKKWLDKI